MINAAAVFMQRPSPSGFFGIGEVGKSNLVSGMLVAAAADGPEAAVDMLSPLGDQEGGDNTERGLR